VAIAAGHPSPSKRLASFAPYQRTAPPQAPGINNPPDISSSTGAEIAFDASP
jgi:hypothetical protein